VAIGVRPEQLTLSEPGQGAEGVMDGRIELVERLGSDAYAHFAVPGVGRLTVRCEGDFEASEDTPAAVRIKPNRFHVFDESGVALSHPDRS